MTMHATPRYSMDPVAPPGAAGPAPGPPHAGDEGGALFDPAHVRDVMGYAVRALRRRRRAALLTFVIVMAAAAAGFVIAPRSYVTNTRLLAQRNLVMPVLGNPSRSLPNETDTPTRLASEAIMNHANLVSIVNSTNLLAHWNAHRSIPGRAKDWLRDRVSRPMTHDEQVESLVGSLGKYMWVNVGDGTVTVGVVWPDPYMAYRIVQTAQENFFEERHTQELALISESIAILEQHVADVNNDIRASLDTMNDVRSTVVAGESRGPIPARRVRPNRDVIDAQSRLDVVQHTIGDLEQFRNRRTAELQATLADQRHIYGPAHPQIENTEQMLRALATDSPQLVQLRQESAQLQATLNRLGAEPVANVAPTAADPYLASVAIRSLERMRTDSIVNERQQYARSRLKIAVSSYETLLSRLEAARIELQTARAAFKYKYGVLEPAQVPRTPLKPRPVPIFVGAFALALLLSFFVCVGLELGAGRLVESWQIERSLGIAVLGQAPNP